MIAISTPREKDTTKVIATDMPATALSAELTAVFEETYEYGPEK